jgi:DNA invertase Pin-like site-specific DNA recombinase
MVAAIYARKSTEQSGVAYEQKSSVARQVEHARTYAHRKGWSVADAGFFVRQAIRGTR